MSTSWFVVAEGSKRVFDCDRYSNLFYALGDCDDGDAEYEELLGDSFERYERSFTRDQIVHIATTNLAQAERLKDKGVAEINRRLWAWALRSPEDDVFVLRNWSIWEDDSYELEPEPDPPKYWVRRQQRRSAKWRRAHPNWREEALKAVQDLTKALSAGYERPLEEGHALKVEALDSVMQYVDFDTRHIKVAPPPPPGSILGR